MNMPKVSTIIPTYNRAQTLSRAINSVLQQTYPSLELIVVDDGSTDNTSEVVKSFNDPRIRFVCHGRNRGASAARNTGIKEAKGEYIAFNDSDDEWLPQKLERQMAFFRQDDTGRLGLVICEAEGLCSNNSKFKHNLRYLDFEELIYHRGIGLGTPKLLVNRTLAGSELYFDESLPAIEDWELVLRLSRVMRIGYLAEPLFRFYRPDGPHVNDIRNTLDAQLMVLNKYLSELQIRPKALNRHHEKIALNYYMLKDMAHARDHLQAAIRVYPKRPVIYFFLVSSFLGQFVFHQGLRMVHVIKTLARKMR